MKRAGRGLGYDGQRVMEYVHAAALIVGGAFAVAVVIASKKSERIAAHLDRLLPARVFVAVTLLVLAATRLLQVGPINAVRPLEIFPVMTLVLIGTTYVAIVFSILLGIPQLARAKLPRALVRTQMIFGVFCFVAGVFVLLFRFRLLPPM